MVLVLNEELGGCEGKGKAVPGNTVREKFRFVFPGRADYGSEPHSCPVIHMLFIKLALRLAELEQSDWKIIVPKRYVFRQLCGDYLQPVYAGEELKQMHTNRQSGRCKTSG